VLGLLFIVYEAAGYLLINRKGPVKTQDPTQLIDTLISTVNYPVQVLPTGTARPSLTRIPFTQTPTGTATATSTPDVPYILPAENYIPDVPGKLSNFSLDSEQAMDISPIRGNAYQVLFTNSYPLYHASDDAYSVSYFVYVFSEEGSADDFYDSFTMESLISIYQATYNQRIYPTPLDRLVENIDAIKMFCFNFAGTASQEIHCQTMLKDDNLVGQVTTRLFNLGSSATKAISQANYFVDLLVQNLK
jgi:hypothetical protein